MRECFIEKKFNPKHQALISTAASIMASYSRMGYDLSLRQLYYQFVAHHGLPNSEQSYKMLGNVISDARLAGQLDWNMLVDRGRNTMANSHWDSPREIIEACARQFRIDLWEDQPTHVEVMVEKQALEGVLLPVCQRLDVPFTANKGYSSSSALYETGKRMERKIRDGKRVVVIYLGDHDPSGIDMTRDVLDRLSLFAGVGWWSDGLKAVRGHNSSDLDVDRVALNMPQIEEFNPPPNPAKMTDSRANEYVSIHGYESWELDALDPETLDSLVTGAIRSHLDDDLWTAANMRQDRMRADIQRMADDYEFDGE